MMRRAVEAALDVGLRADEDAVADLEGLEMLEADAAADLQAVAAAPRRRAPDAAAHHGVERLRRRSRSARRARPAPRGPYDAFSDSASPISKSGSGRVSWRP